MEQKHGIGPRREFSPVPECHASLARDGPKAYGLIGQQRTGAYILVAPFVDPPHPFEGQCTDALTGLIRSIFIVCLGEYT